MNAQTTINSKVYKAAIRGFTLFLFVCILIDLVSFLNDSVIIILQQPVLFVKDHLKKNMTGPACSFDKNLSGLRLIIK